MDSESTKKENEYLSALDLSKSARNLYWTMRRCSSTGVYFGGVEGLSRAIKRSPRQTKRLLRQLEQSGAIQGQPRKHGTTLYRFMSPFPEMTPNQLGNVRKVSSNNKNIDILISNSRINPTDKSSEEDSFHSSSSSSKSGEVGMEDKEERNFSFYERMKFEDWEDLFYANHAELKKWLCGFGGKSLTEKMDMVHQWEKQLVATKGSLFPVAEKRRKSYVIVFAQQYDSKTAALPLLKRVLNAYYHSLLTDFEHIGDKAGSPRMMDLGTIKLISKEDEEKQKERLKKRLKLAS